MAKIKNPMIVIDGTSREMTDEEFQSYNTVTSEASQVLNAEKTKVENKEIAIAKLVALGLTEEDLRAMGL